MLCDNSFYNGHITSEINLFFIEERCRLLKRTEKIKLKVTETRILRWMYDVTKPDKISNEYVSEEIKE